MGPSIQSFQVFYARGGAGAGGLLLQRTGTLWSKLGIKKYEWGCGGGACEYCQGLRFTPKGRDKCVPSVHRDGALPRWQSRIPLRGSRPHMQAQLHLFPSCFLLGIKVFNINKRLLLHYTGSYTVLPIYIIFIKRECLVPRSCHDLMRWYHSSCLFLTTFRDMGQVNAYQVFPVWGQKRNAAECRISEGRCLQGIGGGA